MRLPSFRILSDAPGDPGTGGGAPPPTPAAPAPAGPAAATPPPASPAPASAPPATPAGPAAGTPPAASRFTYEEDRSNWVPPTEFQTLQQQRLAAEHRARTYQAMVEAASGVKFPQPQAQVPREVLEAREALEQVYPGLGQFMERAPALLELQQAMQEHGITIDMLQRLPEVIEATDMRYRGQARTLTGDLLNRLQANAGDEPLDPAVKGEVIGMFERYIRAEPARAERYLMHDATLIPEFVEHFQKFTGRFGGTRGAADAAAVRAVQNLPPAPAQGAAPAPGSSAPANAPRDIDAINDSAWAAFTAGRRATG